MTNKAVNDILRKLRENPYTLGDVFEFIFQGIATSKDDVYFLYNCTEVDDDYIEGLSKSLNKRVKIEKGLVKPLLKGEDVHRYEMLNSGKFIIFPYKVVAHKAVLYTTSELAKMYPLGFEYLCQCEHELRGREKGRFNNDKWFQYGRNQGIGYGNIPKLVAPEISLGGNYTFDANGHYYSTTTVYGYIKRNNFKESYYTYMAILNSQLCWWFLVNTGTVLANGYYRSLVSTKIC